MWHGLDWYQNKCDNDYLTRLHHGVCCVDQETEIEENGLLQNSYSHIDARHLCYVAHDTIYLFTFLPDIFLCFSWSKIPCLYCALDKSFWKYNAKLTSVFVLLCELKCFYKNSLPRSWTVSIRWNINLLSVAFSPSTTYLPCRGALILWPIIILKDYDNRVNKVKIFHLIVDWGDEAHVVSP